MAVMGINKKLQFGYETTYGTKVAGTQNLNFLSESLEEVVERGEDETLLVSKSVAGVDILSYSVQGNFNLNLKPENAGDVLFFALGKEASAPVLKAATTAVYEHTLTGMDITDLQPSATLTIDRGVNVKAFTGCLLDKISLGAKAKEVIKVDGTIKGRAKETGSIVGALANPSLETYRFVNGVVKFDDVSYGKITDVKWDYSNSLDEGNFTLDSGMYATTPLHGIKVSEISITAEYDATTATIQEENYKEGAYLDIEFEFISPAEIEAGENYRLKVIMPAVAITEATANVGGKDRIMISLKGKATEKGGVEPTTVIVTDGKATKYKV